MHTHSISNTSGNYQRILLFGIILNLIYIGAEVFFGFQFDSSALLSDAVHNSGDVLTLFFTWISMKFSEKKPSQIFTYGLRRLTILIALLNSLLLFVAVAFIGIEAVERFTSPKSVSGLGISIVAFAGIIINGATALMLMKGSKSDLNIKGAFLHMFADALVSLGVVISGIIIYYTGLYFIDGLTSIIIIIVIIISSWGLFKDALNLSLDAAPKGISIDEIKKYLSGIDGVTDVHDLHVWAMSTTETAMTVHLVLPRYDNDSGIIKKINKDMEDKFNICHCTIQVEFDKPEDNCNKY